MASSIDWSQCLAVEAFPAKSPARGSFGEPRVPVSAIFENLKTSPLDEVLENFHVTREQVLAVLDFRRQEQSSPLEHLRAG